MSQHKMIIEGNENMQTQNTSFNTQKTTKVMLLQMPLISTFIGPLYCKGYTL